MQETVTVQRLHQLEGQLEAAEAALAARSYELEQDGPLSMAFRDLRPRKSWSSYGTGARFFTCLKG